jgi:hypothetical protein
MKQRYIFVIMLLWAGICSVNAQDLIILRNGNTIEGKVIRVTTNQVIYQRSGDIDGPGVIIYRVNVLSIRYEDGREEILNRAPPATQPENTQANKPNTQANKPSAVAGKKNTRAGSSKTPTTGSDEFRWSINANPGSALLSGTSFCVELGKGKFTSDINFIFPSLGGLVYDIDKGFGGLATFNYFGERSNGGFYLGGGIGFVWQHRYGRYTDGAWYTEGYFNEYIFSLGANGGYKFVTSFGLSFRVGGYVGLAFGYTGKRVNAYYKPDLAVGWSF